MANKGLLGDRLSDAQYAYLQNNIANWYNTITVVFCNNTFTSLFIDKYDNNTGYYEMDTIVRDGTVSHSRSNDPSNYRATVWNGDPGIYLYLYGDNGYVEVSSYTTLGMGLIPAVRNVIDTEDLVAIKDTNWVWVNLNNVLGYLKGLGVKAINALTYNDIMELSVEWDSNMSWRIFSPYMIGWVKGQINELNIANYLFKLYGPKWDAMYDVLTAEYNPLENYNMHEQEHTDDVKDESNTGTVDTSNSSTTEETSETNSLVKDTVYAFNSEDASSDKDSDTGTGTNASSTASSTVDTDTTNSYTTNNDLDRELTRAGNIGVTTSQMMIEQELKVRQNIVLNTIKDDITYVMTIPYYGGKY